MSAPTPPDARLASLDALRGAALLGVFVENAQHFFVPGYRALVARPDAGVADHAALWLIQIFFENKVYALFALLFGYGIGLQLARAGSGFVALHAWRMGILLLIGMFHEALLWSGDILATYALLGLLLLPFRALSLRTLARAAAGVLMLPTLALAAVTFAAPLAPGAAEGGRVAAAVVVFGYPFRQACFAFAMFLLGLAAARARGSAQDPLPVPGRRLAGLLAVGLPGSLAFVALIDLSGASIVSWTAVLAEALVALAGPALALAYAAALLRAFERPRWRFALAPLAAAGRLSLTNYLMQSLIGVAVLARLGVIEPPLGILLSVAIYALQIAASVAWLARFRFGPVEWLWRALSYGRVP